MAITIRMLTVTDIHRQVGLYQELVEAVRIHRPHVVACVGDFLHGGPDNEGRLRPRQAAEILAGLPCQEVLFVRGNHEDHHWLTFAEAWERTRRPLYALHGEGFAYEALTVIGFPCFLGMEEAFLGDRKPLPQDPNGWLPELLDAWGEAGKGIWLMHEPLAGTALSEPETPVAGNPEWTDAIQRHQPLLTISGHDHRSPIRNRCWAVRTGRTWSINVGQTPRGPLHFCLVDAEYRWPRPSLPRHVTVRAFPWNETLEIDPNEAVTN
jgi:Icc-related predicted phosphoesterase